MNMPPTAEILNDPNPYAKCPVCEGRGELDVMFHHGPDLVICNSCDGQGELPLAEAVNEQEYIDEHEANPL